MSFGFGIGDIIACSEVAFKTINALKSAGSDFEGLRLDLASLTSVLQALEAEAKGPMPLIKTASMERQNQMRLLLENCTESMKDLQGVVTKYSSWGASNRREFVAWMKFAAKDKRGPREKLAIHTASINIFLTTLSHSSLARLEFLIKNGSQSAHQGSVPDGTKGLDFSTTGASWGGSHSRRKEGVIWQEIGRSLQGEGIADKDVEAFQEEIKAYARYLVRGETPFWREPISKSSERLRRVAPSALRNSNSLRYEEEAKKLALRDEVKLARQTERLSGVVLTESESEIRTARMREDEARHREYEARRREDDARRRQEQREEERFELEVKRRPEATEEEEVVSLAYTFENLFDFDAGLAQAAPEVPSYETEASPETRPTGHDCRRDEQERRDARVYEIQRRIRKLLERRDRYYQERRSDKMADLEINDIPDQVKLLKLEGVAVSHERAWEWDFWCDACDFRIPSDHYHCAQCDDGNWDVCQECWDKGVRCNGRGLHRITFNGRSVAQR